MMDLQIAWNGLKSENAVVRETAKGFVSSLVDMAMLSNAVRFKQVKPNDLSNILMIQEAVYLQNKNLLEQTRRKMIADMNKLKGEVGDIVLVNGEKHMIIETMDGFVTETRDLFKHISMGLYDELEGVSYLERIENEMDNY